MVKLTKSHAPDVPAKLGLAQYKAAVALVRAIGVEGTGMLIFVSGINDITEIVTMLELYPKFLVFPIHSDIPADEQELAFGVTPDDKVIFFYKHFLLVLFAADMDRTYIVYYILCLYIISLNGACSWTSILYLSM